MLCSEKAELQGATGIRITGLRGPREVFGSLRAAWGGSLREGLREDLRKDPSE